MRQGAKASTDAKVLRAKIALNGTGSYKIPTVRPCPSGSAPDDSPVGEKLLYLGLPTDMPGADTHRRVFEGRCKPCTNPHDTVTCLSTFQTG